ncbi:MAG: hypothetical protein IKQ10_09230 [Oscillospiraceae bacterium]|nr:hypothetical protein [Oscillospiraceae bacterium]
MTDGVWQLRRESRRIHGVIVSVNALQTKKTPAGIFSLGRGLLLDKDALITASDCSSLRNRRI